ncbi:uncharacterized protein SCHCODRAFT_01133259 [Schizophyllum commune H4-8]|uniref:Expressed protein n=1 Tax=Schizophyllum commune (strain H4-8 / FGSC 9210) TaxID=578458 RepID=D8QFE1_SCHCM|nr:uncharacterized protein SCHCODRAFT_01133259 [Schizophyllum commune H4-8]KAI5887607.1 hypothetical protein SCHCODRAFT_01133259 [Schizophyllum commune H4-8]
MPPIESNDLWSRFTVNEKGDIPPRELMCMEYGCRHGRIWEPGKTGQIRWCRRCERWMHAACISKQRADVDDLDREDLANFNQGYLTFLLDKDARNRTDVSIQKLILGKDAARDVDVHDNQNRINMPRTTWAEVACIPIRRRTRPGFAPETNELLVQHAIAMVEAGDGAKSVQGQRVADWLSEKAPEAGARALKFILRKDLRKLRKDAIRRFLCTNCNEQIL